MSSGPQNTDEQSLRESLQENPTDWATRKELAHILYDKGSFTEAADIIWNAIEIPSIDLELAFAARILAKASPRKSIRLLTAMLDSNRGKAVQNLGLANALLHHGMVLQAMRFYGAALEADPTLGNPDLEHFILWIDDEETLWGDFSKRRPELGELPWMKRNPEEALKLANKPSMHTTPIKLPGLRPVRNEELSNDFYQQKAEKGADPTPPPSVTIPMDRVDPKYRLFDNQLGAPNGVAAPVEQVTPIEESAPFEEPAPPPPVNTPQRPPAPPMRGVPPQTIPLVAPSGAATPTQQVAANGSPRPPAPPMRGVPPQTIPLVAPSGAATPTQQGAPNGAPRPPAPPMRGVPPRTIPLVAPSAAATPSQQVQPIEEPAEQQEVKSLYAPLMNPFDEPHPDRPRPALPPLPST